MEKDELVVSAATAARLCLAMGAVMFVYAQHGHRARKVRSKI